MALPILMVSDAPDDVQVLRDLLRANGTTNAFTVLESGYEALHYLAAHSKFADRKAYPMPGVLILDLHLPTPGAFEILTWKQAHAELKEMLCVVLAYPDDENGFRQAREFGAKWVLVKPLRSAEIGELIRAFPTYWARSK